MPVTNGNGIVKHGWRIQPYTVWVRSKVVAFCRTRGEAERILLKELDIADKQAERSAARWK